MHMETPIQFTNLTYSRIAVIGLGYVGLPLAIEFASKFDVLGFDTNRDRIRDLRRGVDGTHEANLDALRKVIKRSDVSNQIGLRFSFDKRELKNCNTFIVTVPTPINEFKTPDLRQLLNATETLARIIKRGDVVIYESTVYPGCTEEDCIPVLEEVSGLKLNVDFFVGYSPERINPGDRINTLATIKKVTSGSSAESARFVDELYKSIITAGTFRAASIKVAEASKAIENAQRDINISFVNELALIFDRMGIDTNDVIDAASTKWNFIKYKPGLVGGHCIGVDPYYLAHKAEMLGYHPQVILSGRRVNDSMGAFVASKVVKMMIANNQRIKGASVLVLGFTFKENCPDIRNTRVIDIYNELVSFGLVVDIYDPWVDPVNAKQEYKIAIMNSLENRKQYSAIILAVAHREFIKLNFQEIKIENGIIYDIKGVLDRRLINGRL